MSIKDLCKTISNDPSSHDQPVVLKRLDCETALALTWTLMAKSGLLEGSGHPSFVGRRAWPVPLTGSGAALTGASELLYMPDKTTVSSSKAGLTPLSSLPTCKVPTWAVDKPGHLEGVQTGLHLSLDSLLFCLSPHTAVHCS